MKPYTRMSMIVRRLVPATAFILIVSTSGCATTALKLGARVVGDAVDDADVSKHSRALIGQPPSAADAEFGHRLRTLEEIQSEREMATYPVKEDVLSLYRWVVEIENGRIVALAKMRNDPDGGTSIIKKTVFKEMVTGKTPQEIASMDTFKNQILTLRDRATGNLFRVYDVSGITDFMGARDCVLEFDASDRCRNIWLVGIPASTPDSDLKH